MPHHRACGRSAGTGEANPSLAADAPPDGLPARWTAQVDELLRRRDTGEIARRLELSVLPVTRITSDADGEQAAGYVVGPNHEVQIPGAVRLTRFGRRLIGGIAVACIAAGIGALAWSMNDRPASQRSTTTPTATSDDQYTVSDLESQLEEHLPDSVPDVVVSDVDCQDSDGFVRADQPVPCDVTVDNGVVLELQVELRERDDGKVDLHVDQR